MIAGVYQYYIDNQLKLPKMMGQENQISGKLLKIPTIDHHLRQLGQAAGLLAHVLGLLKVNTTRYFIRFSSFTVRLAIKILNHYRK